MEGFRRALPGPGSPCTTVWRWAARIRNHRAMAKSSLALRLSHARRTEPACAPALRGGGNHLPGLRSRPVYRAPRSAQTLVEEYLEACGQLVRQSCGPAAYGRRERRGAVGVEQDESLAVAHIVEFAEVEA